MFFDQVKSKIRKKDILWAVISVGVVLLSVFLAVSNGFSSEAGWRFGPRFSDMGIPVPNWLVSCIFVVLGLVFLYLFVSSVKDIFTNKTYNDVLEAAKVIGDVDFVDRTLGAISKSSLAKGGELRYDDVAFFYMKGTDVFLVPTKSIDSVQPVKREGKSTEYFVQIHSQGKMVQITTKEADLVPLANDILSRVRAAR